MKTRTLKMRRPTYNHYLVIIMRKTGFYHMREVSQDAKVYTLSGHRYALDHDSAYRLAGWFPWQPVTMNPFKFFYQWLQRRIISVGVLFFEELPDEPDPDFIISPITHSNHVTKGYDRIHPKLFHGAILSPLYKRYEKVRFGPITTSMKTLLLIIGAFVAVVIVLYYAGVWG